jgi:CheY-like chemotaxis protein
MTNSRTVLYIDDDHDDIEIITAAIRQADPNLNIQVAENGMAALEYLNAAKENEKPLPSLIILDINMPYLDGAATFEKIRQDPFMKELPLFIFTSSENPNDAAYFKAKGVELIHKPHNISNIHATISQMLQACKG